MPTFLRILSRSQPPNSRNPMASKGSGPHSLISALLATALFRCWHLIVLSGAWATLWTCLQELNISDIAIQNTLLTVIGTVLGFVISYRTTSSFERYNEGRRYWSQIVLASRTFARSTWFHVPDILPGPSDADRSEEEQRARSLIEKKTAINLIEAFAVAVKHYLRGEQGVFYQDLYPLIKSLPPYALPPTVVPEQHGQEDRTATNSVSFDKSRNSVGRNSNVQGLPLPATSPRSPLFRTRFPTRLDKSIGNRIKLLPARLPPTFSFYDVFPFSLLARVLMKRGMEFGGRKAARYRAKRGEGKVEGNVPLEITLYLSSYVSALQTRKLDVATTNQLLTALNQLVDALTGLERILTTPIPFSYSAHLWITTTLYVGALPFQIVNQLHWVTIPATILASFIFFGFLVAGEEIENPFGYDKNDLDLDHFCQNIIRLELIAITSLAVPDPADWAFSAANDFVFDNGYTLGAEGSVNHATPEEWIKRGSSAMKRVMEAGPDEHVNGIV